MGNATIDLVPGANPADPPNSTGKVAARVGWIGREPTGTGQTGAWFKKVWIGGTSIANAPFVADASGNVSINLAGTTGWAGGSVNVGGAGMTFTDGVNATVIHGNSVSTGSVVTGSINAAFFQSPTGGSGIFGTRTVVDGSGVSHTVTISGGIITGWT